MREPGETVRGYRERLLNRPWARRFLRLVGPEPIPRWAHWSACGVLWACGLGLMALAQQGALGFRIAIAIFGLSVILLTPRRGNPWIALAGWVAGLYLFGLAFLR